MRIGIAYDNLRKEEKMLLEAGRRLGYDVELHQVKDGYFTVSSKRDVDFGDVVLQRCVSYFRGLGITALLEAKGYQVVNDLQSCLLTGNKLFTTALLEKAGIPTPKTMLAFTKEGGLKALDELGYPAVLKPVIGSWGRLVALLKDRDSAEAVLEDRSYMFPLYQLYYLQEFVKRPPRDIRAFVVGDRVVAAIYRISQNWKTNTALGGRAEDCPVTEELEELVLKAVETVGEGVYGVDCMESEDGYLVHEINGTVEFRHSVSVTGVDIPGEIIKYAARRAKR
ncbi:MAG: lysine biosynthesis protein LysX [Thaumarchaeota archaeon]|nr:lysine biosynthesis protein LysX [Nitrososphaerota archaeon]